MKRIQFAFLSFSNAENFTSALTQEGFQVRWMTEKKRRKIYLVEVVVPELNIKD